MADTFELGEGFHGAGAPLSGFKVPQHVGKVKGLEAAQKRLDVQRRIGKGGVLGGRAVAGRSVREVLAEVSSSLLSVFNPNRSSGC